MTALKIALFAVIALLTLTACSQPGAQSKQSVAKPPLGDYLPLELFYALDDDEPSALLALKQIQARWKDAYAPMLLEMIYFSTSDLVDLAMTQQLVSASGIPWQGGYDPYHRWVWNSKPDLHPRYSEFLATIYSEVDSDFAEYFEGYPKATIRLDEVLWGGVNRDGIPPLVNPKMISASAARWLDDDNLVFGVSIDGDARAYPKRILAWHELFRDRIASRPLTGVYCTLCGAMILYDSTIAGTHHVLGTSGFLYRSNKLMYDHATASMWSTLTGEPVIGDLVGKGIKLKTLPVVTTTWGEWRERHPDTKVLSLQTGRIRDYSEGAAYREYFATDRLMFTVPKLDKRLKNKAEVLALRFDGEPLAISADYLARHPVHHDRAGQTDFVVLTDSSGANRVYESSGVRFERWNGRDTVYDGDGKPWKLSETALTNDQGQTRERLSAHRSFWFGWYAQFPATRLVK